MKNKIRTEYLFPNIENERKLKWLKNAKLSPTVADHEIVKWGFSEYLYHLYRENYQYTTGPTNEDITDEVIAYKIEHEMEFISKEQLEALKERFLLSRREEIEVLYQKKVQKMKKE
jgi:hypothetical protein